MKVRSAALIGAALAGALAATLLVIRSRPPRDTYRPVDTKPGHPLPPEVAVTRIHVPKGFQVTLAAAEPQVRQPIAFCFDDRGRLWVAECYSYDGGDFTQENHDRILIFEDKDGDGVYRTRKIFYDHLNRLTGLAWGFGGIWVTTPPVVAFIPCRKDGDTPAGKPVVVLDGFTVHAQHNSLNGLMWGPDGWLYGRHGIMEASHPGVPGTPPKQRPELSCGIWRYQPVSHAFQIVADGTVNPWGMDFDDRGQMFISTSVVEPVWHVVPGSHFARWLGRDVPVLPHIYELMRTTSDHYQRELDGGHAHSGAMIYLGGKWPDEYRGTLFMSNVIGQRINRDFLVRSPGGGRFLAEHGPDFLTVDDPWFRAVSIDYGPDGDVIMSDWSDTGECHDRDGVHRNSGRLYKISYGPPQKVVVRLEEASTPQLVDYQRDRNDWYVRHARRLLEERAARGEDMTAARESLRGLFERAPDAPLKLRALWALHVIGGANPAWLSSLLAQPDESIRYWALRLLVDSGPPDASATASMLRSARGETSWLARMAFASVLPSVDAADRWKLGSILASQLGDGDDPNLVRLLWSGWQPAVAANVDGGLALAPSLRSSRLRNWIARRYAEEAADGPAGIGPLLASIDRARSLGTSGAMIEGMEAGLEIRSYPISEEALAVLRRNYSASAGDLQSPSLFLGAKLGDPRAVDGLRGEIFDSSRTPASRAAALNALVPLRPAWMPDALLGLIRNGVLAETAIRAMAAYDDPRIPAAILGCYSQWDRKLRSAAIDTLLARPAWIRSLLDEVAAGRIPRSDISQFQARQATSTADPETRKRFDEVWGRASESSAQLAAQIHAYFMIFKDKAYMATANLERGRAKFYDTCGVCHTLYGRGGKIGPDLTGADRKDLNFLLLHIVDPYAVIPADYRLAVANLKDGRVINGTVAAERDHSVVLQTLNGDVTVERANLVSLERLNVSMMPMGLFDSMTMEQRRDLLGYVMSDGLPEDHR